MSMDSKVLFGIPCAVVMDPVHGGIKLHRHEKAVIDHPLFQRLRHISQTSLLSSVFPGCTHTRFEHSIGTMHVAGKVFRNLLRSHLRDRGLEGIPERQRGTLQSLYFCLRLAALLHDTGHAPFSHQFEDCPAVKKILCQPRRVLDSLWEESSWNSAYEELPDRLKHEHYSVRCADRILSDVGAGPGLPVEKSDVLSIMDKTSLSVSPSMRDGLDLLDAAFGISDDDLCKRVFVFLRSLLSGELDVDKMDYMLRDSYYSGCKLGVYNLDHLISALRIGFDEEWIGLAVAEKGMGALEDFVYSRFQLYTQIYSHKTAVGLSWLLDEAVAEVMQEREAQVEEFLCEIERFALFFESFFWESFRGIAERFPKSASGRLIGRQKLKHAGSVRDLPDFRVRQEARGRVFKESSSKFSRICPSFDGIRVLVGPKGSRRLESLSEHSGFFEKFHDTRVVHIYEDPGLSQPVRSDAASADGSSATGSEESGSRGEVASAAASVE